MANALLLGAIAIGGAINAVGAINEGEANAQAAEYNARQNEKDADLVLQQADQDIKRERVLGEQAFGSIRAAYGASGVTTDGTPRDYIENQRAILETNVLNYYNQAKLQAQGLRDDAAMMRKNAGYSRQGGILKAAGGGLGTAADIFRSQGVGLKRTT